MCRFKWLPVIFTVLLKASLRETIRKASLSFGSFLFSFRVLRTARVTIGFNAFFIEVEEVDRILSVSDGTRLGIDSFVFSLRYSFKRSLTNRLSNL
jgi:hypothetical protein